MIGHLCMDVIHHPDGTESRGYGGIFYSVAALANLLPPADTIVPVFGVGKEEHDALLERLGGYPNIDVSGIFTFTGPTNEVHLYYSDTARRIECSKHISDPVSMKRIRPFLHTDMLLVNMISGFDIELETLDEIRMDVRDDHTPVYLDVHSLTLGVKDDFTRYHRPVEVWRRWLFMIHAAQMNEEEAAILSPEKFDEETLARHALALNTKMLAITRGARGATAFIDEHKHVRRVDTDAERVDGAADPTGCGDVFAAAYCARYLRTSDIVESVRFANRVAGAKAAIHGPDAIDRLGAFRLEEVTRVGAPL